MPGRLVSRSADKDEFRRGTSDQPRLASRTSAATNQALLAAGPSFPSRKPATGRACSWMICPIWQGAGMRTLFSRRRRDLAGWRLRCGRTWNAISRTAELHRLGAVHIPKAVGKSGKKDGFNPEVRGGRPGSDRSGSGEKPLGDLAAENNAGKP